MRRAFALLALAAATLACVTATIAAAATPAPDDSDSTPTLTLLSQPAWTPTGGDLAIGLEADPAAPNLDVRYSIYGRLMSRTAFDETLTGTGLGTLLARNAVEYDSLPLAQDGGRVLLLGLQSPTDGNDTRLPAELPGVYPLAIDLVGGGGERVDGFVTYLVVMEPATPLQPAVAERLQVAWVWPLQAAPALLPEGTPDPGVVDELRPSGRIGRQARVLAQAPGVPVTIVPGPETVDSWASLAPTDRRLQRSFDDLTAATLTNQVLTGPYVALDIPAIVAGGLGDRIGPELVAGGAALERVLGAPLDPGIAIVQPANETALEELRAVGVDRVFLDANALEPEAFELTLARPFALQAGDNQVIGSAGDPVLESILTGDGAPALRAQQLLAGLSIVALELPGVARGVSLVNPPDWNPPLRFLEAALGGLADHPLLQPVTANTYFDLGLEPEADGAGILVRELAPAEAPEEPPVTAEAYYNAFQEQDAFRAFLGVGDPKLAAGDRALQVVLSRAYQSPVGHLQAAAQLGVVTRTIANELALIRVPEEGTITLTAREGDVPVTFLNETGREVTVRVQLDSQQLQFPDGTDREIVLPPRSSTVRFAVEARAPGNYPLTLDVTTVNGGLDIQSTRVHVRSTFVSGVGKFLTIGAALFLAVWWALDIRYRRKRKRVAASA